MSKFLTRLYELIFGKKFDVNKARELLALIDSGVKVDPTTVTTVLKIMDIENTVATEVAKQNSAYTAQITSLDEAIDQITDSEEQAEKTLQEQIEKLRKAREDVATAAEAQVTANEQEMADLENSIKDTERLKIFA
ncbi:MAG: hypothetical protein WA063_03575 [Minisyncoccia bacterium]